MGIKLVGSSESPQHTSAKHRFHRHQASIETLLLRGPEANVIFVWVTSD